MRFGKAKVKFKQFLWIVINRITVRALGLVKRLRMDGTSELGERNRRHVPRSRSNSRYERPQARRLTAEQAKLKLFGHLTIGNVGAKDLLDLFFLEGDLTKPPSAPGDGGPQAVA